MELVPIVITVLEIVTVFAIATLTISYIIFRIRQKTQPEAGANNSEQQDMKPHFVGQGLKRLTQMTREILPPVRKEEPKPVRQQQKSPPPQKKQEKRIEKRTEHNSRRIEVVNNPSTTGKIPEQVNLKTVTKNRVDLNSLGEDILDKYMDEDKENLYTLKTNKKEEKNK